MRTSPLRIAFDAKRAATNQAGLGSYSRNAIRYLSHLYPENSYQLYSPCDVRSEYQHLLSAKNVSFKRVKWNVSGRAEKDQIDLFHGLSHTLPLGLKCRTVVTMHDLIFKRHPEWYRWHDRLSYDLRFRSATARADRIVSISETTKRDLIDFYNVPEEKISVTYQPCNEAYQPRPLSDEGARKLRLKFDLSRNLIVCVGTLERRKNGLSILNAFARLGRKNEDFELVFIGKETSYAKEIRNEVLKHGLSNVRFLSYVGIDDLVGLYNLAHLSIYLPHFEGFGLPVLESMQCGTPVLTSNTSSLVEVGGGDSAFYADPSSVESISSELERALYDASAYESVLSSIPKQIAQFSPEATTKRLMSVYRHLI